VVSDRAGLTDAGFRDRLTDGFSVETAALARCMIDVAKNGAERAIFDNRAIRNWPSR
jgi:hypothetical protein